MQDQRAITIGRLRYLTVTLATPKDQVQAIGAGRYAICKQGVSGSSCPWPLPAACPIRRAARRGPATRTIQWRIRSRPFRHGNRREEAADRQSLARP